MQIQAINGVSFNGAEKPADKQNNAVNKKIDESAVYFSKSQLYQAKKLSVGREAADGNYKISSILAGFGAAIASIAAFLKSIKSLNLNKKLDKAVKDSASSERIAELKKAALKKQKGSTAALGIALALTFISIGAKAKNKFEADKTAKERGFMPDKEIDEKAVKDRDTIDKALKDTEIKEETKETSKDNNNEDNKKPAQ